MRTTSWNLNTIANVYTENASSFCHALPQSKGIKGATAKRKR